MQLHTAILETSSVTITHQANEKLPTWKQVAQVETHTCYKLHTQHSARHSRGVPSTSAVGTQHTEIYEMQQKQESL